MTTLPNLIHVYPSPSHLGFINSIKCTNKNSRGTKLMKEIQPHPKCGKGERQQMKAMFLSINQLFCWFWNFLSCCSNVNFIANLSIKKLAKSPFFFQPTNSPAQPSINIKYIETTFNVVFILLLKSSKFIPKKKNYRKSTLIP